MTQSYYDDYEKLLSELIEDNWDTTIVERPIVYYSETDNISHDYRRHSAMFAFMGPMPYSIQGIDYGSLGKEVTVNIALRGLKREKVVKQVDTLVHTLLSKRRNFDGWDYIRVASVTKDRDFVGFYSFMIDVQLKRLAQPIMSEGV